MGEGAAVRQSYYLSEKREVISCTISQGKRAGKRIGGNNEKGDGIMKKVKVIIDRVSDSGYQAYCADDPMLFGAGESVEQARDEMMETIRIIKEELGKNASLIYPEWLDEDYCFEYKFDVPSFLTYYSGIITPTALGKLSGINSKQIWNYMHGVSKPRRAQVEKIEKALHRLGAELISLSL